jgi:hypothetical protein
MMILRYDGAILTVAVDSIFPKPDKILTYLAECFCDCTVGPRG